MTSDLFLAFTIVIIHLIVGGIILINIGKKKSKKGLVIAGWVMIAHVPVLVFIIFGIASAASSVATMILIFFMPIAILIGFIIAMTYSIILVVNGFTNHRVGKIIGGFALFTSILVIVATPIVLISIFGLPIAMM